MLNKALPKLVGLFIKPKPVYEADFVLLKGAGHGI